MHNLLQFVFNEHTNVSAFPTDQLKGGLSTTCSGWQEIEGERYISQCVSSLTRWYACPRNNVASANRDDAWFARQEVNNGLMGWQYDVCCNDQNSNSSAKLSETGFCEQSEYNPGVDFCIRSLGVACKDRHTGTIYTVANQCCYADGILIEKPNLGVGRMQLVESSFGTIEEHLEADLQPFKACCLDSEDTYDCERFYRYRPVISGTYWSRVIRMARGDPHITTIDNLNYTFNGLNVYRLLVTDFTYPTEVQASTRVSGNGTVFSGLAVKTRNTTLECFISRSNDFRMIINDVQVQPNLLKSFVFGSVHVTGNTTENSYTIVFRENELIVKIVITDSFLNIFTSVPPTFRQHMKGLLGFYDNDPKNDFLNSC